MYEILDSNLIVIDKNLFIMTNTYNQKQKPNKNKIIIKIANFINYKSEQINIIIQILFIFNINYLTFFFFFLYTIIVYID